VVNTSRYALVNNTQSTTPKKKNVGAIVGGAAGGGAVAVGLLIVGFLNAHNLFYFFNSLVRRLLCIKIYLGNLIFFFQAFALFGWLLFSRRRLIFKTDKDVGPVDVVFRCQKVVIVLTEELQITLFLSTQKDIKDSGIDARETLLAWQVCCDNQSVLINHTDLFQVIKIGHSREL